ncbi:hypothetical protein COLSTE_00804 [Collinsella stercoris DSM 13279]|uniref:Uncharacterized protein n=1 Tax=Collinsella stercoris DSM 13279 TaxID=445975 RepID=B6G9R4_9ACTN|nr:hypothetical protein COLSTE_00804 [Collinsella stercoris DSM 13279]
MPISRNHLEDRLVGYARAQLGAQAHRYLAVPASVGGAGEYLRGGLPKLGPRGRLRVRQRIIVARPGQARAFQQVGKEVAP